MSEPEPHAARFWRLLGVIAVAGLALRIAGLGGQSFWRDEASTALELRGGLGDTLHNVATLDAQPPGYFVLAWLWTQPFGLGEAGLRSLSVLFGAATVPVAGLIGRHWSPRAGLVAAALVATNPFLVWYAQEARPYALFSCLAALTLLFWLEERWWPWALAAGAALLSQYFAVFILLPQAVLLLRRRGRAALGPVAVPAVVGLALVPLVLSQDDARVDSLDHTSLGPRAVNVVKHWFTGLYGTPVDVLGIVAVVLAVAGLALAIRTNRHALAFLGILVAALAASIVPRFVGSDYFGDRSEIALLAPLLTVIAAGFAVRNGVWLAVAAVALGAFFTLDTLANDRLHREDWRGVVRALPPQTALIVSPDADRPLRWYVPGIAALGGSPVGSLAFVTSWRFGRPRVPTPPAPAGFALAGRTDGPTTTTVRFTANPPAPIDVPTLVSEWRPYAAPSTAFFAP